MRTIFLNSLAKGLLLGSLMVCGAYAASDHTPLQRQEPAGASQDMAMLKMLYAAMDSRVYIQKVAKDYLYAGNDIETTKAEKEMKASLKRFDALQKELSDSFSDPKIKNLLTFIRMNREEMLEIINKPYSTDNAQELIDLAEAISEGENKIAQYFRSKIKKDYPVGKGERYLVAQIAKYYIAYQSGIKDQNTVRQMKKVVQEFQKRLEAMRSYTRNSVEMNQVLNQIDKLWKVVHQFYLDIEEGGLPLIVYQTTEKLDRKIDRYARLMLAQVSGSKQ